MSGTGSVRRAEEGFSQERGEMPLRIAVVVAGGSGTRMAAGTAEESPEAHGQKKQYLDLGGKPLMVYALEAMEQSALIDAVVIVVSPGDADYVRQEMVLRFGFQKVRDIVPGGKERYHSVYAGLCAAAKLGAADDALVFIHDAARPFLTEEILKRVYDGVLQYGACVAAMPVKDTIKQADENGFVTGTPDRKTLWAMQTPQTFRFSLAYEAYGRLMEEEKQGAALSFVTDDAMVVERYFRGQQVFLAKGAYTNIKVTTPEDLVVAGQLLKKQGAGR